VSNKLPSVTSDIPRDLRTFIDRLREIITGSGNDRLISAQDLINGGIAGPGNNGTLVPPTTGKIGTPPAPKNLTTTVSVNDIFVEWDNPTYYGHDYTEVYSGSTDVIGDAVLLGFTPGINYVDTIGPQQSRYYWARFVNTNGTKGPFNSVSGTIGTTGVEVTHILNVLNGAITETQLYSTLGSRINLIDASASTTNSVAWRVAQEATARTAAISAEATTRANAITSEAGTRAQAIIDEAAARTSGDSGLQTQINLLSAASSGDLGDLLAAVQEEQTARIAGDAAEATARTTLATQLRGSYTGTDSSVLATGIIYNERQTRITAEGVISSSVSALSSTVNNNYTTLNSAITSEATTRASADSTLSTQLTTLTSTVGTNTAAISSEATTRASADSTLSSQISALTSTVSGNTAAISTETTTRANADAALTSSITALTSTVDSNTAAIQTEATTRANADTALSSSISTLTSSVAANGAAITSEATTRANADSALSSSITTLQSTAGENTTAIQTEATTRASETGSLFAKYTVKIDSNGYVSGFGLASTANNATPFSDFIVRADRFSISSPTGPGITPVTPFIVTTTQSTIDGTVVPAGVYIDGAYIKGGTIKGSAIEAGTITGTKLIDVSANKITGAALAATSYIESAAYIAGSQGWKIHANGTAEFAAASIRGQLTASQIDSRGLTIKDSNGTVLFGSGTPITYSSISGTPTLGPLATASTISYTSVTGLGTLATQSSVAASNVTGLGTLATQSSVAASNVTGLGSLATKSTVSWTTDITSIPSFGNFAYLSSITSANISTYIAAAAIGNAYISDLNATKINAGTISADVLDSAIISAKVANISAATITSGTFGSVRIGDATIDTLKLTNGAVTNTVSVSGLPNTDITSGNSYYITTAYATYPVGTIVNVFFTCVKVDYGSGDINLYLNIVNASNILVATFLGQSGNEAVQTMGPGGDKVTCTFTGTYTITVEGSYAFQALVQNNYGNSWRSKHADLIAFASKR